MEAWIWNNATTKTDMNNKKRTRCLGWTPTANIYLASGKGRVDDGQTSFNRKQKRILFAAKEEASTIRSQQPTIGALYGGAFRRYKFDWEP